MTLSDLKRWVITMLATAVVLWPGAAAAAAPAAWKDTGFSINANAMTLREVLQEFGRVYGVRVSISANAERYMKGRLKAESGTEFLDRIAQLYKFRWFVYSDTLYVVPRDENASVRLEVGEDAVQDAKAALVGLGLFDSRFGWGELPDEGIIIVGGPRAYVDLVREVLLPDEAKTRLKGKQVMVFRLKYANATDRVISKRGTSETIPGVKTVLSKLLFGPESSDSGDKFDAGSTKRSRHGNSGAGAAREVGDTASPLKVLPTRDGAESDSDRPHKSTGGARDGRPRIEADPSLNALMIYDNVSKREMYQSLIAQLDVQPEQIEIEALIVDIERSKLTEMGVEWGVRRGDTISRINATGADSRGVELPLPGATLLISNAARFYARLKALEGSGEARVLAKPTVLTLNNVAAVLDLSQTSYVPLVGERVAELADITAGTMLRVVPRIVREGDNTRVRLEIDIEDGSLGDPGLKSSVTRSTISTQAIIDMQQTLMIGGYHTESMSRNKQQVPLLGDVPLFGNLFRNESQSHGSRERLFLITPRLAGTVGTPAPAESKATRAARKVALTQGQSDSNPRLSDLPGVAGDASMNPGIPVASPAPTTPAALAAPSLPLESERPRGQAAEPPSRESSAIDADPDFEFLARPVSRPVPERIGGRAPQPPLTRPPGPGLPPTPTSLF